MVTTRTLTQGTPLPQPPCKWESLRSLHSVSLCQLLGISVSKKRSIGRSFGETIANRHWRFDDPLHTWPACVVKACDNSRRHWCDASIASPNLFLPSRSTPQHLAMTDGADGDDDDDECSEARQLVRCIPIALRSIGSTLPRLRH